MSGLFSSPSSSQTSQQVQEAYLPSWFGVPQEEMLKQSFDKAMKPYTPFPGAQIAGLTPDQLAVQSNILGQGMPITWGQSADAYRKGLGTTGTTLNRYNAFQPGQSFGIAKGYNPITSNTFDLANQYKPVASNALSNLLKYYDFKKFNPANITSNYDPGQFETESFTQPGVSSKYMNPYIQEALNPTIRKIQEAGQQQAIANNYAANQAKAFGGSRHGVLQAQQQRDTLQELSDVEAEGMAAAYAAAANLHGTERARFLDAFVNNEQARQAGADLDLRAAIATDASRQFGATHGLAQAGLRLNADQFDIGNRINQNQFGAQHRLGAKQFDVTANNQNRYNKYNMLLNAKQFDNSLGAQTAYNKAMAGLQGANSYYSGAAGLGNLSNSYMAARSAMLSQQQQAAQQQQALMQRMLDQRYTNYVEGRDWDKNNLSWLAQLMQSLRVPTEVSTQTYQPNTSYWSMLQKYQNDQEIDRAEGGAVPTPGGLPAAVLKIVDG